MEIKVKRKQFLNDRTIGELFIDDKFFCKTLEDTYRGLKNTMSNAEIDKIKLVGKTACPSGRYRLILSFSIKLKRFLPLILDVPRGKGVRLHKGSGPEYTNACVLLGFKINKENRLREYQEAEIELMKILETANKKEPLYITIE